MHREDFVNAPEGEVVEPGELPATYESAWPGGRVVIHCATDPGAAPALTQHKLIDPLVHALAGRTDTPAWRAAFDAS